MVGGLLIAGTSAASPIVGYGVPNDAILNGTVVDFESVATDVFPTSFPASTNPGDPPGSNPNYIDPRVGARTSQTIGDLTISGSDTLNGGAASALYFTPEVTLVKAYNPVDPTDFTFVDYTGPEDFNVSGVSMQNWAKRVVNQATGEYQDFQPNYTNEFRFDFATTMNTFGFNFGANDANWILRAYDSDDNLLEELEIGYVAIGEVSDGQFYGIYAENMAYVTLTDTFVNAIGAGGVCDTGVEICGDWVMIDNITYGNDGLRGAVVPVPAAMPLMLAGLAGFAVASRRKRA
ncbi:VPLPA-CTERM sorting domain-containing protein [Rhodovulum sp. DZ06]|uniref:VPLPA-CTERM sorting domain-containing protein n=1 Tax=Rhodovulum sp. DZ06 TaxID=3425126 RepID=UPI003D343C65